MLAFITKLYWHVFNVEHDGFRVLFWTFHSLSRTVFDSVKTMLIVQNGH